jgi:hypothetical protein
VQVCIDRITATLERDTGDGVDSTYEKLASTSSTSLSDVLVERLAKIVLAAGERCSVVLSSTWRLPRYVRRARRLENAIGAHLGRPFRFDDRTDMYEDHSGGEGRLRCIGDYVEGYCRKRGGELDKLRLVVLEDFHTSPMGSWRCGSSPMDCVEDVERYLCSRVPASFKVCAKLIHTYDQWHTSAGLLVQVGSGITYERFCDALIFLDKDSQDTEYASEEYTSEESDDSSEDLASNDSTSTSASTSADSPRVGGKANDERQPSAMSVLASKLGEVITVCR